MRTRRTRVLVVVAAGVALAGCGTEAGGRDAGPANAPASATSTPVPTGLKCPGPERVGTAGGLLAGTPAGSPTREELVATTSTPERPMVLAGNSAFVLRPDGTASEEHFIVDGSRGFYFHGYVGC